MRRCAGWSDPGTTSTTVGSSKSSDGVTDPNGVTSVTSGSDRFIRAGYQVVLTSGSALATASIAGTIELIQS